MASRATKPPKEPAAQRPRAWQRMLSGRRLDLLDPAPLDVEIDDIAHGLARVARWNGQTEGDHAFTVAEHCVLVDDICARFRPGWPVRWRLAALLHDAPEYVIGDMISPFKAALGGAYSDVEARLQTAIHQRFGLPASPPDHVARTIKRADRICAYYEAIQIAGFEPDEARAFFGSPRNVRPLVIRAVGAVEAQKRYLERFGELFAPAPLK